MEGSPKIAMYPGAAAVMLAEGPDPPLTGFRVESERRQERSPLSVIEPG